MKKLCFILVTSLLLSCHQDIDQPLIDNSIIDWRTLPNYILPYQYPSGYIETEESANLTTWNAGYTASFNSSLFGTTSTIYGYQIPDNYRRCITVYQNSSGDLRSVEYLDGASSWTIPSGISNASSDFLPSIELNDGFVYEAHAGDLEGGSDRFVWGSSKAAGSSWSSSNYLYKTVGLVNSKIKSDYSPSIEYHNSAGVEFLVTAVLQQGLPPFGKPEIYWRNGTSTYNVSSTQPSAITLGTSDPVERNSSVTPIAVEDNGNYKLYLFYTESGTSTASQMQIKFIVGSISSSGSGNFSGWSSANNVTNASTNHKIDGFFDFNTERLVIVYHNPSTDEIDLAYSDDFGSSWSFVNGIAEATGAPSIANLE